MNNNERMFAALVDTNGRRGIISGAGTRSEVLQDISDLKRRGVNMSKVDIIPVIGKPRVKTEVKVVEKQVPVYINSRTADEGFDFESFLTGAAVGAGLGFTGYYLYKKVLK